MPKIPYPYDVNGKLVTGNGSLIPICSLSNRSLLSSLTVTSHTLKSDNLQYNTVGRWVDGTIVPPSDGPMFTLMDWE